MIIAVVGRFVIGAAVLAPGSAGTTGKAAAITPGEGDGAEYIRTQELK
jgi:hypothetical protein